MYGLIRAATRLAAADWIVNGGAWLRDRTPLPWTQRGGGWLVEWVVHFSATSKSQIHYAQAPGKDALINQRKGPPRQRHLAGGKCKTPVNCIPVIALTLNCIRRTRHLKCWFLYIFSNFFKQFLFNAIYRRKMQNACKLHSNDRI